MTVLKASVKTQKTDFMKHKTQKKRMHELMSSYCDIRNDNKKTPTNITEIIRVMSRIINMTIINF